MLRSCWGLVRMPNRRQTPAGKEEEEEEEAATKQVINCQSHLGRGEVQERADCRSGGQVE